MKTMLMDLQNKVYPFSNSETEQSTPKLRVFYIVI